MPLFYEWTRDYIKEFRLDAAGNLAPGQRFAFGQTVSYSVSVTDEAAPPPTVGSRQLALPLSLGVARDDRIRPRA